MNKINTPINNAPLISVVIPLFNAEQYLETCLQSIVTQSLNNIEILVINDCSSDNSLEIAQKFASQDNRIKIINNQTNLGAGATRNLGIQLAQGKYIHFVDSDDYLEPIHAYKELYEYALLNRLDVLVFAYFKLYNNKAVPCKFSYKLRARKKRVFNTLADKQFFISSKVAVIPFNKLMLREFLINHQITFPEGYIFEDVAFFWKVLIAAKNISFLDIPFIYYRQHVATSVMATRFDKNNDIFPVIQDAYEFLVKNNYLADYAEVFTTKLLKTYTTLFKKSLPEQKANFFELIQNSLASMQLEKYIHNKRLLKKLNRLQHISLNMLKLLVKTKLL